MVAVEGTLKIRMTAKCSQFNTTANVNGSLINDAIAGLVAATNGVSLQASAASGSYAMQLTGTHRGNNTNEVVAVTVTMTYMPANGKSWERAVSITLAPGDVSTMGFEFAS